ncbi:MAG TPA: hypothetical protein VHV51_10100 [Polyangiaceae bacterium]|jgi:hypothetical protein|nr:hypothetical protein [Polyangiaceae bacterium]
MDWCPDFSANFTVSAATSEREDEESYLEDAIELDPIDDPGNDDQESQQLDVGEEIENLLGENAGDNEPVELDLGSFVGAESVNDDGGEDELEITVDPAVGLELPEALLPDDGAEGIEDGGFNVDESKFPALEQDDGSEGVAAERDVLLGSTSDEAPVPLAAIAWRAFEPKASLEACSALSVRGKNVVAASSDLLWFRGDESAPLRLAIDGSALSDLALLGPREDIALALTKSGQLFRRARFASQAEQLSRFREYVRAAAGMRAPFGFGGASEDGARVLLLGADGTLLDVLDGGDGFERVEPSGKVLAVARESRAALVAERRERKLIWLGPEREPARELFGSALLVAQAETPLFASSGECVALGEFSHAIVVSRDRGRSFQRVSGSASTTALAGGTVAGAARFFAAVYRETTDRSEILLVDPELGTASCIARIDGASEATAGDPVERGEWAKVARLIWQPASERLWAVGGFGVLSFAEPSQI